EEVWRRRRVGRPPGGLWCRRRRAPVCVPGCAVPQRSLPPRLPATRSPDRPSTRRGACPCRRRWPGCSPKVGCGGERRCRAAGAMGEESWCALVDLLDAGLVAGATLGLALDRAVVVPRPGPDAPVVLAAVVDGFDVLVLGRGTGLAERDQRSLTSRLRVRGA